MLASAAEKEDLKNVKTVINIAPSPFTISHPGMTFKKVDMTLSLTDVTAIAWCFIHDIQFNYLRLYDLRVLNFEIV